MNDKNPKKESRPSRFSPDSRFVSDGPFPPAASKDNRRPAATLRATSLCVVMFAGFRAETRSDRLRFVSGDKKDGVAVLRFVVADRKFSFVRWDSRQRERAVHAVVNLSVPERLPAEFMRLRNAYVFNPKSEGWEGVAPEDPILLEFLADDPTHAEWHVRLPIPRESARESGKGFTAIYGHASNAPVLLAPSAGVDMRTLRSMFRHLEGVEFGE